MSTQRKYGWRPDLPDHRDLMLAVAPPAKLPPSIDLRPQCPAVYDQGELGSCTANATAGAMQFVQPALTPSRLFIYYNERAIEHAIQTDSGAQIRDGIKSLAKQGVCPESEWVYDTTKFAEKPIEQCYADALANRAMDYRRVPRSLQTMKSALASGRPFAFGFSVYESFESEQVAETGVVPMPQWNETVLGGHAVLCVGYDDMLSRFIVRNSWGNGWGQHGYFTMSYSYLLNKGLASDFWVIRSTTQTAAVLA